MGFVRQVAIDSSQNYCPSQSQLTTSWGSLRHLMLYRHCTLEHCPLTWNSFNFSNSQYKAVWLHVHNSAYKAFSPFGVDQAWSDLGKYMLIVSAHLVLHVFALGFQDILLPLIIWKPRLGWLCCFQFLLLLLVKEMYGVWFIPDIRNFLSVSQPFENGREWPWPAPQHH